MQDSHTDIQIGTAWRQHREGRYADAIRTFEEIRTQIPSHVDAHYGLGLALRASDRQAEAVEAFQKALEYAGHRLEAIRDQFGAEHSLETTEDDRYLMLTRMIKQRLAELGVSSN